MAEKSSKASASSSEETELVHVLWDLNSCPLTQSAVGLVEKIEKALCMVHANDPNPTRYRLSDKRIVYGDLETLSETDIDCLQKDGFTVTNCIERHVYCKEHIKGNEDKPNTPAAELELEDKLLDLLLTYERNRKRETVLLASSDAHFRHSLRHLGQRFTFFIALSGKEEVKQAGLWKHGSAAWEWESMERDGSGLFHCSY